MQLSNNSRDNNRQQKGPFTERPRTTALKHGPRKLTCYYCEGEHKVKNCVKLAREKSKDKQRDTDVTKHYKSKLWDAMQKGNITINEASFARMPEMTYSVEQMEQLLGNLQLSNSDWLDRYPSQVTVDEVCHGHVIKYKVTVNNVPVNMLYDTGASDELYGQKVFWHTAH